MFVKTRINYQFGLVKVMFYLIYEDKIRKFALQV
jgi:hypothetical protein